MAAQRPFQEPTHGKTARGYKWARRICSCEECFNLDSQEQKRIHYRRDTGHSDPADVPIGDVRRMIRRMMLRGIPLTQIADETGRHQRYMQILMKPTKLKPAPKTVRRSFYARLRKMELETRGKQFKGTRARRDYTPADTSRNAIHGLMLQGYSQAWIAQRMNELNGGKNSSDTKHVSKISRGASEVVLLRTEKALVQIAKEVGLKQGPDVRAHNLAVKRGYKSLATWDELT